MLSSLVLSAAYNLRHVAKFWSQVLVARGQRWFRTSRDPYLLKGLSLFLTPVEATGLKLLRTFVAERELEGHGVL